MLCLVLLSILATCSCKVYTATDTPVYVPDQSSGSSFLYLSGRGYIAHMRVQFITNHTRVSDFTLNLSNGAQSVNLFQTSCNSSGIDATFDDWGYLQGCNIASPAISGLVVTSSPLSAFNGQPIAGTWKLMMTDNVGDEEGHILKFTLDVMIVGDTLEVFDAQNLPLSVPDLSCPSYVSRDISTTSSSHFLSFEYVKVTALHTWIGDLIYQLTQVSTGKILLLMNRARNAGGGTCSGDNPNTWFTDSATLSTNSCVLANPGLNGNYSAFNGTLSQFTGDLKGTWRFSACDALGGDTGNITSYSVAFRTLATNCSHPNSSLGTAPLSFSDTICNNDYFFHTFDTSSPFATINFTAPEFISASLYTKNDALLTPSITLLGGESITIPVFSHPMKILLVSQNENVESYTISISEVACANDTYESNNILANASLIEVTDGFQLEASLCSADDADFFHFEVLVRSLIVITAQPTRFLFFEVYDSNLTFYNSDTFYPGDYYLRVDSTLELPSYTLNFDVIECNSNSSSFPGTTIPFVNGTTEASICGDSDYFTITATSKKQMTLVVSPLKGSLQLNGTLPLPQTFTYNVEANDVISFDVSSATNSNGKYIISLVLLPPPCVNDGYEPNNEDATALSGDSGSVTAVACRGDLDIYAVTISARGTLNISIELVYLDEAQFAYQILDPSNNTLDLAFLNSSLIELSFNCTPGTYLLVLGDATLSGRANYTLSWYAEAAPLTTGSVTSGDISTGEVTSSAVTSAAVTSGEVTSAAITSGDVTSGEVTSAAITSASVTSAKVTTGFVTTGDNNRTQPLTTSKQDDIEIRESSAHFIAASVLSFFCLFV